VNQRKQPSKGRWNKVLLWGGLVAGIVSVPVVGMAAMPHIHPGPAGHHRAETAKELRAHLGKAADFAFCTEDSRGPCLVTVDAAQRERIDTVLDGVAPKMFAHRGEARGLHDEMRDQLSAEQIDRGDVEEVRRDGLDLADRASKDILDAIVDIAEVLTPEQRRQIAERAEGRHGRKSLH
jgi:hypothetical protein